MGTLMHYAALSSPQLRFLAFRIRYCSSEVTSISRRQVLEQVDKQVTNGDERAALSLVKDSQAKPGGLRFGSARQVPQRLYTLDELKLNGIEPSSLLSHVDTTLGSIERNLQTAAVFEGIAAWNVSFNGGVGCLIVDTIGHKFSQKYHNRVIQSIHFIQINSGKVSATMLNRFSCIALAGVATEHLLYGYAEGRLADINKLKSLGFTQKKADSQVRWSVLNTILILHRYEVARAKLADAMSSGKSVGSLLRHY